MVQKDSLKKIKILILAGATAVGKSALSVKLAQLYNGEIISADSMQVYKGLDIGTGKITSKEMEGIKHHLLDIKNPDEEFSVSEYVFEAEKAIGDITSRGNLPILVGGTGLYINALLNGYNFAQAPKSEEIREKLNTILLEKGSEYLYKQLEKIDEESAQKISINDSKRIIRALEIFELTGEAKSKIATNSQNSRYDYKLVILNEDRKVLYDKINQRVNKMVELGLLDEVSGLLKYKDCQSMQAIGYKEIVAFYNNECTLDAAIESIKQNSRHYAKRQMTYFRWLKAEKIFVDKSNEQEIIKIMTDFVGMSNIVQV